MPSFGEVEIKYKGVNSMAEDLHELTKKAVEKFNSHKGFAVIYYDASTSNVRCVTHNRDNIEAMYPENRYEVIVASKCCAFGHERTQVRFVLKKIMDHRKEAAFPKIHSDATFR